MNNNRVFIAAAGNGKTYKIVEEALALSKKSKKIILLISYTNEGVLNLEKELKEQSNFSSTNNIEIKTWYSFLLNECIKPYQCLLDLKSSKTHQKFDIPPNYIKSVERLSENNSSKKDWYRRENKENIEYYVNKEQDLILNNISDLVCKLNSDSKNKLIRRLEQIYSHIFIDEIQDYCGWDLEFFTILLESNISTTFVGDPRQTTFSTNDSRKNKKFKWKNITEYFKQKEKENKCNLIYCNETRRCNKYICQFVNTIYEKEEWYIKPYKSDLNTNNEHVGVFLIKEKDVESYWNTYSKAIILRWDKRTKINIKKHCNCMIYNYGNSKGATFDRVIIYPTKPLLQFIANNESILKDISKSKFYVACTRAKYSIAIVIDNFDDIEKTNKFKKTNIKLQDLNIESFKFFLE